MMSIMFMLLLIMSLILMFMILVLMFVTVMLHMLMFMIVILHPQGGGRGKDHSRSPMSNRRRHDGNRENPDKSKCIGVFGLSLYTTERELEKEFGKFGPIERTQVVLDGHSGRSRGFAFIYYEQMDDASEAREALNGVELDGRKIRVDFSITKRAHTPTPGMYMGRPTHSKEDRRGPPR
jgi:transformer-2 protein